MALWLEAHNPGEPLNFLDHRIKCGNAIVGFVRREEVDAGVPDEAFAKLPADDPEVAKKIRARNKSERKGRDQKKFAFTKDRQGQIDAVLDKWKTIAAMPERVPAEIDAKKDAFNEFMSSGAAFVLKQIASIPIAQFYLPRTEANEPKLITDEAFREYWSGNLAPQGQAPAAAVGVATKKRFFHWFLEFPEIIQRGGFDCILGNPPYLGRGGIRSSYGDAFCNEVQWAFSPAGISDIVVFFLRRMFETLRTNGFIAFITTNSIKDGDVRTDGLELLRKRNAAIIYARRSLAWPGRAKLFVSLLAMHKGSWTRPALLDGKTVPLISSNLEDEQDTEGPINLQQNSCRLGQGTIFLGDGFLLNAEEFSRLSRTSPESLEVIRPLLNGAEVNGSPIANPTRYIIDFADRPHADAAQYPELLMRLEQRVKPEREKKGDPGKWWQHWRPRTDLYAAAREHSHCFVIARTTKHMCFSLQPTELVFSDALHVFCTDRWDLFATVQSTTHEAWARKYSGSLKQDLRYSPSDCFETFAFPEGLWQTPSAGLADIGARYHEHRRQLMLSLWLGLTDVYNLFHSRELESDLAKHFASRAKKDPAGSSIPEEHRAGAVAFTLDAARAGIVELRRLHVELDTAVRDAYGWQDLPLEHDFYE
ncbi:MAG: type IIL restriction-modification enzyme MmeI, partial [Planctomycetota bacterium]